ncbi:ABC transporter permease [Aurantivibrio infirmus]
MLAFRLLWRNWRSGEVKILASALMLAVAVVTAISVFTNRLEIALVKESAAFLGADQVVESSQNISERWFVEAEQFGVEQARAVEFISMVFSSDTMNLASVKAVTRKYPLLGDLLVSEVPFAVADQDISIAEGIPAPGEAWVDSRLLPLLEAQLGSEIQVGDKRLTVTKVIISEPDRGGGMAMISPRLLMNEQDLLATNVIQPGSRVSYKWLLSGTNSQLDKTLEWLQPKLTDHQRLLNLESSQQQLANALDRGKRFLLLAGIVGVLLAGVAIAIAAQQFAARHVDQVALMKSLGAGANKVRYLYVMQLLILAACAALVGLAVGEIIQRLVTTTLASLFPVVLGSASVSAYGTGVMTGFVCLLFFALPPLWHLPTIPPIKILRRELPIKHLRAWAQGSFGVAAVLLLIFIYSGNVFLTFSVFLSLAALVTIAACIAWWMLRVGRQLGMRAGSVWRLALASLQRNPGQSTMQILVFSTAIMLLLAMTVIRTSLIGEWQLQLPENAPNHIFLNIAGGERDAIQLMLDENELDVDGEFSPMLRGRLTQRNGEAFSEETREENWVLRRELNFSWTDKLPEDNEIVEGEWFSVGAEKVNFPNENANEVEVIGGVSVEVEVAERLGLAIGDVLQFSIGGLNANLQVQNFRSVNRDSFEWYLFLMEPGVLDKFSPVYRRDVYLPAEKKLFVNDLLLAHPTVTVFEFDKILEQIRNIVTQVSRGVELVLWLVIVGGLLVLLAAVNASMDTRLQEAGLLRALGSRRQLILGSVWTEFSVLGFFAGLLAVIGSEVLLLGLQFWILDVPVQPHLMIWVLGTLIGTVLIGLLGLISCRRVVTAAPAVVLREAAA